jgi:hypothetical protein
LDTLKFNQFASGCVKPAIDLGLPRQLSSSLLIRPDGYRLSEVAYRIEVLLDGEVGEGFGEGDFAHDKAISEAVERAALKSVWRTGDSVSSSNGWAAHITPEKAVEAALLELLERHVALTSWEEAACFTEVPSFLWPANLLKWQVTQAEKAEFSKLKVLLSGTSECAAISVLLFKEAGGFVAGHASSLDFESAVLSAAHECFRAGHAALRFQHYIDVSELHSGVQGRIYEPGVHSLAYAYGHLPQMPLRIRTGSKDEILSVWNSHVENFLALRLGATVSKFFRAGNRFIACVEHPGLKSIYWGRPKSKTKNQCPHFVG